MLPICLRVVHRNQQREISALTLATPYLKKLPVDVPLYHMHTLKLTRTHATVSCRRVCVQRSRPHYGLETKRLVWLLFGLERCRQALP